MEEVQVDGSLFGEPGGVEGGSSEKDSSDTVEPSDGSGVEGAGGAPQTVLFRSNLMREPGGLATTEASFCLSVGTMEAHPS